MFDDKRVVQSSSVMLYVSWCIKLLRSTKYSDFTSYAPGPVIPSDSVQQQT